jgi:hypothetical protein
MQTSPQEASPKRRSRWAGFIGDVRNETATFKEILRQGATQQERSNVQFTQSAQRSFNAIHNIVRRKIDESGRPPAQRRGPSQSAPTLAIPESPFEYDFKIANHDRWPVRPVTRGTQRIFAPVRLRDYPKITRPKDIPYLTGWPVTKNGELL